MADTAMKPYIGTKTILAKPMTRADAEALLGRDIGGTRQGDGYLVEYKDGYQSWSPKDVFEEAYSEILNLEQAGSVEHQCCGKCKGETQSNETGNFSGQVSVSMDGFRRNLTGSVEQLRNIVEQMLDDEDACINYESLEIAMNEVIQESNILNCMYNDSIPDFSDMSELSVKPLGDDTNDD